MKKSRLHLVFLLWFMASMSIANTHIHHDTNEHSHCVKCYAYDMMNGADVPIEEPRSVELPIYTSIFLPDCTNLQTVMYTFLYARAPPISILSPSF